MLDNCRNLFCYRYHWKNFIIDSNNIRTLMSKKKIRVTNELIKCLDNGGIEQMTRAELRALFRKGYVERRQVQMNDGSVRYAYKPVSPNII